MSTKSDYAVTIHDTVERPAAILRIMDANGNRAVEGLRVTEDYLRFVREDAHLGRFCKEIRHAVSRTLSALPLTSRLACRSTESDVGTQTGTESEYQRRDAEAVAIANLRRAAEALRTLEEYAKLISADVAKEFEACRYRTYTLEKSIGHFVRADRRLGDARLYVLVDLQFGVDTAFESRIQSLVQGGVDVIQLRDKKGTDRQIIAASEAVMRITSDSETLFMVNDRPDIARIVGADGVHVGQDELDATQARQIVGPDMLIGVSTHSLEQAKEAVLLGADYIGVGPVFESRTKSFRSYVGTELLEQVAREVSLPAFAIGGIDQDRVKQVLAAGMPRVAVSNAIWMASDPGKAAETMAEMLNPDGEPSSAGVVVEEGGRQR